MTDNLKIAFYISLALFGFGLRYAISPDTKAIYRKICGVIGAASFAVLAIVIQKIYGV